MPKFKPVVRKNYVNGDGKINVKISVQHRGKIRYLKTDYYVTPIVKEVKGKVQVDVSHCFNMKQGRILPHEGFASESAHRANNRLLMLMGSYAAKFDQYSLEEMSRMAMPLIMKILRESREYYDFFAVLDDEVAQLDKAGKIGYRNILVDTRQKVTKFVVDIELPFESITKEWLKKFEQHMILSGNKINTAGVHLRNVRKIYNVAISKGLVDINRYPFRGYSIPRQRTIKRNVTRDEMKAIINYSARNKHQQWSRDIFVLSFCLIGINMKDLFYLNLADYDQASSRIEYLRFKGKQVYSVKVFPQAMEIMERYKGSAFKPNPRNKKPQDRKLLDTLEGRYYHYKEATRQVNIQMKRVAEAVGINKPVSTYYARHTWATLASRLGVPSDTIAYALGHSHVNPMTAIYLDFDQDRVDEANKLIIDSLFS